MSSSAQIASSAVIELGVAESRIIARHQACCSASAVADGTSHSKTRFV